MDLTAFQEQAKQAKAGLKTFFDKLKKQKPADLDKIAHAFHDEAFEHIDCLSCANCCKTTSPIFRSADIERVAKHLRMKPGAFQEKYLKMDEDGDYVLHAAPCPFLDADNYCLVYDSRPTACREYPHTNRKRFVQLLDLTLNNTAICPAALEIAEKLKQHYTR